VQGRSFLSTMAPLTQCPRRPSRYPPTSRTAHTSCNGSSHEPACGKPRSVRRITYGVHDSNGIVDKASPFYRSCANIQISGGAALTAKPAGSCLFEYQGGDRALQDANKLDTVRQLAPVWSILMCDQSQCSYWKFNALTKAGDYYQPDGLYDKAGILVTDATALR
jgi:hypothetical protein